MNSDTNEFPSKIAQGILYLLAKGLVVNLSAAIFFMFIARFLPTVSDLGLVSGLFVIIGIGVILASLGLPGAATRFISRYIGSGNIKEAEGLPKLILTIGFASSAVLSFLLYIFAEYIAIAFFHNDAYISLIHYASIDVFFLSMITFSISLLLAHQEFKKISIVSIMNSILKFFLALLFLFLGLDIQGIVFGLIIGDAISFGIYLYFIRSYVMKKSTSSLRSLFNFSMPLYGSAILDFLSLNIDRQLLLILATLHDVGVYTPAFMLASMLIMMLAALDQSLLPAFSRVYGKSGLKQFENLSRYISRYLFLIFLPLGFITMVSVEPFIIGVFGERYSESVFPAWIIISAVTLTSIGTMFNNILISSGHTKIFMKSNAVAISVQTAVSFFTIPHIGVLGTAIGRAASFWVLFIIPGYKLNKITGLHFDLNALKNGIIGSFFMAAVIYTINYFTSPYFLPISIFCGFIVYLLSLRLSKIVTEKDIDMLNTLITGRFRIFTKIIIKIVVN